MSYPTYIRICFWPPYFLREPTDNNEIIHSILFHMYLRLDPLLRLFLRSFFREREGRPEWSI